jgi:hypothetical protein
VVDQCEAQRQINGGRDLFQVCISYFNPLEFIVQMGE